MTRIILALILATLGVLSVIRPSAEEATDFIEDLDSPSSGGAHRVS